MSDPHPPPAAGLLTGHLATGNPCQGIFVPARPAAERAVAEVELWAKDRYYFPVSLSDHSSQRHEQACHHHSVVTNFSVKTRKPDLCYCDLAQSFVNGCLDRSVNLNFQVQYPRLLVAWLDPCFVMSGCFQPGFSCPSPTDN